MAILHRPAPPGFSLPVEVVGRRRGKPFGPITRMGRRWILAAPPRPTLGIFTKIPLILIIFQKYPSHIYFLLCIKTLCYFAREFGVKWLVLDY
jgi:hypothetical protein